MNIENMKKLVGQLERLPDEKFDMSELITHRECGTVACIAGWASLLNGGPKRLRESRRGKNNYTAWNFAAKFLGIDPDGKETQDLFYGHWSHKPLFAVTRTEATAELKRLIAAAEASAGAVEGVGSEVGG